MKMNNEDNSGFGQFDAGLEGQKSFGIKHSPETFRILSANLYSDSAKAVLRELCTNAYDSHIMANQTKPFEVTITRDSLIIRDFGVGMDHDKIMNVYSTFFESDKTGDNKQQGGFGLGSKAFLAYTDQATISAFDGSSERIYTVAVGKEGPYIAPLGTRNSPAPRGIKVEVALQPHHHINDKAYRVLSAFPPRSFTLRVHGQDIQVGYLLDAHSNRDESLSTDTVTVYTPRHWNAEGPQALMGNVLYPIRADIGNDILDFTSRNGYPSCIFHFEIGELDLPPSREALRYSDRTVAAIRKHYQAFSESILDRVKGHLTGKGDKVTRLREYYTSLHKIARFMGWKSQTAVIDGVEYPNKLLLTKPIEAVRVVPQSKGKLRVNYDTIETSYITDDQYRLMHNKNTFIVRGPEDKLLHINKWIRAKYEETPGGIFVSDSLPTFDNCDLKPNLEVVTYGQILDELKEIREAERAQRVRKKYSKKSNVFVKPNTRGMVEPTEDELAAAKYYIPINGHYMIDKDQDEISDYDDKYVDFDWVLTALGLANKTVYVRKRAVSDLEKDGSIKALNSVIDYYFQSKLTAEQQEAYKYQYLEKNASEMLLYEVQGKLLWKWLPDNEVTDEEREAVQLAARIAAVTGDVTQAMNRFVMYDAGYTHTDKKQRYVATKAELDSKKAALESLYDKCREKFPILFYKSTTPSIRGRRERYCFFYGNILTANGLEDYLKSQ